MPVWMQRARMPIVGIAVLLIGVHELAHAQEAPERTSEGPITERIEEGGQTREVAQQWSHTGLLRGRDLSPFGLLRLDMLPAHTADAEAGTWTFEVQYAYQNTFVLSDNVRDYLQQRNIGREPLRPEDAAAILSLPGDAYYVDGEIGLADLILQRRINE